jgi:hypothetical protein
MHAYRRFSSLSGLLLAGLFLAACAGIQTTPVPTGGPVTDVAGLIDGLRAAGAVVEPAGALEQPFFDVQAQLLAVSDQEVQVFEFAGAADAEAAASTISQNGSSVGTTMVTWVATPHFYAAGRLIALYVGDDEATLHLLEDILGPAYATGQAAVQVSPATAEPTVPVSPVEAHPAAGLVFSTMDGLWRIGLDGGAAAVFDRPNAQLSLDGSQVVYYFYDGSQGEYDVWLADLASGERRNLTNSPERLDMDPQWWPARPGVVVFGSTTGEAFCDGYPSVVGVDGSGYQVLDEEEGGPVALSPDGQSIAYGAYEVPGRIYRWGVGTEVFDPALYGVQAQKLYRPAWSSDGRRLAWEVGGDLTGEGLFQLGIAVFDLETESAELFHVIAPVGGGMFPHYLAWSPDDHWLAFVTFGESAAGGRAPSLWVAHPDGQDEVALGTGLDPAWSPDGSHLAYLAVSEDGQQALWLAKTGTWESFQLSVEGQVNSIRGWISPQS